MKKFKAMFAATAAVMALSAVSVPMSAFAEELVPGTQVYQYDGNHHEESWNPGQKEGQKLSTDEGGPSSPVKVEFSIEPTYIVTIPADVKINTNTRHNMEESLVRVDNVFLNKEKAVRVSVASANAYEMKLNLEGGALDPNNKIPYSLFGEVQVGTGGGIVEIVNRDQQSSVVPEADVFTPIIDVPTGSTNTPGSGSAALTYFISDNQDIPLAGTYSDRLTFQIKVVDDERQ